MSRYVGFTVRTIGASHERTEWYRQDGTIDDTGYTTPISHPQLHAIVFDTNRQVKAGKVKVVVAVDGFTVTELERGK